MASWLTSRRRAPRLERFAGNGMIVAAMVLGVWAVWLGSSLPPDPLPRQWSTAYFGLDNYSLTWVGLDCLEVLGLAACGVLFRRASRHTRTIALLCIPVFLLDAWFDILTATTRADLVAATVMAVLGELPAACMLCWIAWKALEFPEPSRHKARTDHEQTLALPDRRSGA
jgi:hypothetical protein